MAIRDLTDLDVHGQRVLIRVDFNVPLDDQGRITDDTRIRAALPTIRHITDRGGKAVLVSHLGRPKGVTEALRLKPVAERLSELLGKSVGMTQDCIGGAVEQQTLSLRNGDCLLLENVRFHPEEEKNDTTFARALARMGDIFVNDAFGTAHRAHASTEGVTHYIATSAAGFLMRRELDFLSGAVSHPKRPFVVLLGGAKVSDKIAVIRRFIDLADRIIIGGGMAYTFLRSQGTPVGRSLVDESHLEFAGEMMEKAKEAGKPLLLPIDHVAGERLDADTPARVTKDIPEGWMGLDIGPATRDLFEPIILQAGAILWNGPMGVFEMKPFSGGTARVAEAVAGATDRGAITIIGGGDTAAAVSLLGLESRMSHVSTGGGASLELLEGRELPGVAALSRKER